MNVLSLFDGMSCGHQALDRANIKVDKYFASEIDKYAINVTMANYPETIQLGDVRNLDGSKLPQIDLLIGGSPCQSFSFAGKKNGMATKCEVEILSLQHYLELKAEQYEFEGQSYLFWEFIRMMNEVKPKYFLLENVVMIEKWEKVLSKAIGVNPIKINSSLVSAQNRVRLYWTNIGMESSGFFGDLESIIKQPKDQCIFLRDILETDVDEKYFMSDKAVNGIMQHKKEQKEKGFRFGAVIKNENQKMNSLKIGGHGIDDLVLDSTFERTSNTGNNRQVRQLSENNKSNGGTQPYQQDRVYDINGIAPTLTTMSKNDRIFVHSNDVVGGTFRTFQDGNGFREVSGSKASTIQARAREDGSGQNGVSIHGKVRRLTPTECERLQNVADGYTNHVSDSQRYKMLGNGWTINVIAHIFSYI